MLLFLNDISGSEVLVILIVVLMFFGSKSIPGIAQTLGKTMRQIKDASDELKHEIKKSGVDIKKDLNLEGIIQKTTKDIQQPLDQYVEDIEDAIKYEPVKTNLHQSEKKHIQNQSQSDNLTGNLPNEPES